MIDPVYGLFACTIAATGLGLIACAAGARVTAKWHRARHRLRIARDANAALAHSLSVMRQRASDRGRRAREIQIAQRRQIVLDKMHQLQREVADRRAGLAGRIAA